MPNAIDTLRERVRRVPRWNSDQDSAPSTRDCYAALADVEELLQAGALIGTYEIATKGSPHIQIRSEYVDALAAAVRRVTGET